MLRNAKFYILGFYRKCQSPPLWVVPCSSMSLLNLFFSLSANKQLYQYNRKEKDTSDTPTISNIFTIDYNYKDNEPRELIIIISKHKISVFSIHQNDKDSEPHEIIIRISKIKIPALTISYNDKDGEPREISRSKLLKSKPWP